MEARQNHNRKERLTMGKHFPCWSNVLPFKWTWSSFNWNCLKAHSNEFRRYVMEADPSTERVNWVRVPLPRNVNTWTLEIIQSVEKGQINHFNVYISISLEYHIAVCFGTWKDKIDQEQNKKIARLCNAHMFQKADTYKRSVLWSQKFALKCWQSTSSALWGDSATGKVFLEQEQSNLIW